MKEKHDNRVLSKDFRDFLECLTKRKVKYLIIGGYAVGAYGYARATNDLDIFIDISDDNVKKLKQACIDFGIPENQISNELFTSDRIIKIGDEPFKIELIKQLSRFSFSEVYAHKTTKEIDGLEVVLLSIEDLILSKKAAARPMDLADLEVLEKIRNKISRD